MTDTNTEIETRTKVRKAAGRISYMAAMKMNRHDRRHMAKENHAKAITGSNKPFVKL